MSQMERSSGKNPMTGVWLITYLDLLLLLLTLFVFLVAIRRDPSGAWVRFRHAFAEEVNWRERATPPPQLSEAHAGGHEDAWLALLRQMAAEGVNRNSMERMLSRSMIRSLGVREGQNGLAVALPSIPGKGGPDLTAPQTRLLALLVQTLPYELEVCSVTGGVGAGEVETAWSEAFERACRFSDRLVELGAPVARIRPAARVEGGGITRFQLVFREVL